MFKVLIIISSMLMAMIVNTGLCPLCIIDCCSCSEPMPVEQEHSCCHTEEETPDPEDHDECQGGCLKSMDNAFPMTTSYSSIEFSANNFTFCAPVVTEEIVLEQKVDFSDIGPPSHTLHYCISTTILLI